MIIYSARILDRSSGTYLFTAPGVHSPERLGQVTATAMSKLVIRDGHRPEDLELRTSVSAPGGHRAMSASEAAAMDAALGEIGATPTITAASI
jgi:hypothetical protein